MANLSCRGYGSGSPGLHSEEDSRELVDSASYMISTAAPNYTSSKINLFVITQEMAPEDETKLHRAAHVHQEASIVTVLILNRVPQTR